MAKTRWFTKLDIIAVFHKIRIQSDKKYKTVFRIQYRLYEWNIILFGLIGVPAIFQRYINHILHEYLNIFISAYIDNIIIYSDGTLADHRQKIYKMFTKLQQAGLQCNIKKSEFEQTEMKYLEYILYAEEEITVNSVKIEVIKSQSISITTKKIRSFIRFANFYRIFISKFADLAEPLVVLIKKDTVFQQNKICQYRFEKLKNLFVSVLILVYFETGKEIIVETDMSGQTIEDMLSQVQKNGSLKSYIYLSQQLSLVEINYEIHNKKLLSII